MSEHAPVQAIQTPAPVLPAANGFHLQRKCACGSYAGGGECEKCHEDKTKLQRAACSAEKPDRLPLIVHDVLRSSGQPLDTGTRTWMEPRFGHDFSSVRVHTDARAAESAQAVNALAYTVGRDVVFGTGQYEPGTDKGSRLLAHELTHVVQQAGSGSSAWQAAKAVSDPSDAAEVEADATANRVMSGEAARVTQAPSATLHALTPEQTGGLIGGLVGAAAIGLGIAALAGAFDKEHFSPADLTAYLTVLATTHHIENHRDSDNKARDVVRHWRAGEVAFNINNGFRATGGNLSAVELKRLLIKEMLSGVTGGADEESILTILENSSTNEILQLLDPTHGLSTQDIDRKVGGDNHDRFEQLLEARLPRTGANAARQRERTGPTCSARQGLMIDFARRRAVEAVDNAITALSTRTGETGVIGALTCRFPGASPPQVNDIRAVFERTRAALPRRIYHCGAEGGEGELAGMVARDQAGNTRNIDCISEFAVTFGQNAGTAQATTIDEVFLCADFFRQAPEGQVITVIHESVHQAGILTDPKYQPGCGLALSTALVNPDSYAYLATDLLSLPAAGSGVQQSGQQQVQRDASSEDAPDQLPLAVHYALRSPGQPLDQATRAWMEPRFGHDFSQVRLHTDPTAAQSARGVNAHAYTVGRDIVFGDGQYAPGTEKGTKLLAHELTHVAQQQDGVATAARAAKTVSHPSDAAEVEAENAAKQVASGNAVQVTQPPSATLHALTGLETAGVVTGVIGGLAGIGVAIAAGVGAFDSSRFRDCSTDWRNRISASTELAHSWIDTAISRVDAVLSDPENAEPFVVEQLRHHFHIAPTATNDLNRLRSGLAEIQAGFGQVTFECESECEESDTEAAAGYVLGFMGGIILRYGRIHLCPYWFRHQDPDVRAETIAHEMAHRFAGRRGDIYRRANANAYHALTTDQALENADSFAQFAKVVFNIGSRREAASETATTPAPTQGGQVQREALASSGSISAEDD